MGLDDGFVFLGSFVVSLPPGPTPTGSTPGIGSCDSRLRIAAQLLEARIGTEQQPSLGHRQDGLAFFPNAIQVSGEVGERLERRALPLAFDERPGQRRFAGLLVGQRRIALQVCLLAVVLHQTEPPAPGPVLAQLVLGDLGPPREHHFRRAHVRRHDPDEIVRAEDPVDQADQRFGDIVRTGDADVRRVEEDHEHAVARVCRRLQHVALRVRLDGVGLRPGRPHDDVLEGGDLLRDAVFGDLEVGAGEIRDRLAVAGRIDINPDKVGSGPERRGLLLWRLGGQRRGNQKGDDESRPTGSSGSHGSAGSTGAGSAVRPVRQVRQAR